jgi:hypothetical protein
MLRDRFCPVALVPHLKDHALSVVDRHVRGQPRRATSWARVQIAQFVYSERNLELCEAFPGHFGLLEG